MVVIDTPSNYHLSLNDELINESLSYFDLIDIVYILSKDNHDISNIIEMETSISYLRSLDRSIKDMPSHHSI